MKRTCDCHVHVFGPPERYPFSADRKYTPPQAGVGELLALHEKLGLERVVIVQASPYGADNRCLLDSLQRLGKRARGVAVIDQDTSLIPMHGLGVRGVRVNLQTGGERDPAVARRLIEQAAPRRAARLASAALDRREHARRAARLPRRASRAARARSFRPGPKRPGCRAAALAPALGQYLDQASAPHRVGGDVDEVARLFIAARAERLVWGTDWPHPGMGPRRPELIQPFDAIDDAAALARLRGWAGSEALLQRILVDNPAKLYDFQEER